MRPLSFVLFRFVSFRVISCHVFLRPCIHALILPCHPLFSDCFTDFTCSHADFISSHPPFARSYVHLERATPSTHCVCRRLSYKPPILLMVIVLFISFPKLPPGHGRALLVKNLTSVGTVVLTYLESCNIYSDPTRLTTLFRT